MPASAEQQFLEAFQAHLHAPESASALLQICIALSNAQRDEQMLPWADKGLALDPNNASLVHARARALRLQGRCDEAIATWVAYRNLAWNPLFYGRRIGRDLYLSGETTLAIERLEATLRNAPAEDPTETQKVRRWLAEALLSLGDTRGFTHWLSRNDCDCGNYRFANVPMWNGQRDLRGERVLVTHQLGFGDQFLLFSCLRRWLDAGAEIMLTCDEHIREVVRASLPECTVLAMDRPLNTCAPLPSWALKHVEAFAPTLQATLLHLPLLSATDNPRPDPYFSAYVHASAASSERAATWSQTLRARQPGKRLVGLFWDCEQRHDATTGSRVRSWATLRSVPLAQIERLTTDAALTREIHFVSLHPVEAEFAGGTPQGALSHYAPGVASFDDTVACMAQLDAVVSVEAVAANLSAMMGKPTAVLVNTIGDWRWGRTGVSSPWLRSATVLRQSTMGDWQDVISRTIGWLLQQ